MCYSATGAGRWSARGGYCGRYSVREDPRAGAARKNILTDGSCTNVPLNSPEQPADLSAASAALDPEDAQALRPLIEDLLDGRYDFNAQFERGLEAILRGWS